MIAHFNKYLAKQTQRSDLISELPNELLKVIVILPVYNEPDLNATLQSIQQCQKPCSKVEVIIIINHTEHTAETIKQQNKITYQETKEWALKNSSQEIKYHAVFVPNMPKKYAGVGLARKLAMDEAISRFNKIDQANGIICSLDADTLISDNYLIDIENAFRKDKKLLLAIPAFEHRLSGNEALNNAICEYELHLRYFKLAIHYTGFPFAYHTIGSAFAVSAEAYVKQGGMNKKQGGEDFYFLQKIFQLGHTKELNKVKVFPSNRPSDRVPFGTGPAIQKIISEGAFESYQFIYFDYLQTLFANIQSLYNNSNASITAYYNQLHPSIKEFLSSDDFLNRILEIQNNSSSEKAFVQRFYRWFDAFKMIKYLNFVHLSNPRIPVKNAAIQYLDSIGKEYPANPNCTILLNLLKEIEITT